MHRNRMNERQMRGPRRRDIGHDLLAERLSEWGSGGGRGGHRRMRRGDIRTSLLVALGDGPAHGYELITRLEEKSGGAWRPSPGSVYPTLQLFEDEGLVRSEERDGKRVDPLTDAGRTEAAERVERYGRHPVGHRAPTVDDGTPALFKALGQLAMATNQLRGADPARSTGDRRHPDGQQRSCTRSSPRTDPPPRAERGPSGAHGVDPAVHVHHLAGGGSGTSPRAEPRRPGPPASASVTSQPEGGPLAPGGLEAGEARGSTWPPWSGPDRPPPG